MRSMFNKPVTQLIKENLKNNKFNPNVPESSGLSDELTDEDIKKLIEEGDK